MADPQTEFQAQVAALRRTQILDAATGVFAERGFHRSTIRDVARAAGVADGTIYNYFENKEALLLAILARMNESDQRDADLAKIGEMGPRDFFRHYFAQRFAVLTQDGMRVFRLLLSEVLVNPELRARYVAQVVAPTFALAEHHLGAAAGVDALADMDLPMTIRVLAATFIGLLVLRVLEDPLLETRWDDLPDLLTTLFLDGLLPETRG